MGVIKCSLINELLVKLWARLKSKIKQTNKQKLQTKQNIKPQQNQQGMPYLSNGKSRKFLAS